MPARTFFAASIIIAAGAAAPVLAQDSVSSIPDPQPAGASDALSPWDAALQCSAYTIDTTPFESSWANNFRIAPLMKGSKISANFETSLISAQAISAEIIESEFFGSYAHWDSPGQGIHPVNNTAPDSIITPRGCSRQFGVAFSEFTGAANVITSGVVSFDPADPTRLYVDRTVAATNSLTGATSNSILGFGSVDEFGVVAFRADNNNATGANQISGNNLLQVASLDRNCGVINQVWNDPATGGTTNTADAAASIVVVENDATVIPVPNILPTSQGGPVPVGGTFDSEYLHGIPAQFDPFPATTRGSVAYSATPSLGEAGAVGTIAILGQATGQPTRLLQVADIDASSDIIGAIRIYNGASGLPFVDPTTGFTLAQGGGGLLDAEWDFDHYHSQTPFQGGVSQIDVGADQAGRTLAVAFVDVLGDNGQHPQGALVAMRDADGLANGNEEWSIVAYNGDFNFVFTNLGRGKPVLDGSGNAIGYISTTLEQTNGNTLGPSITPGGFDSVGNVWFVSTVEFIDGPGDTTVDPADIETCLLRAVYNPADFSYDLELIVRAGQLFTGENSGRSYAVDMFAFTIADSNSISSGAFYSGNVSDRAFAGIDPATLDTEDPRTTGGVILSAAAQYDADGDGFISFNAGNAGDNDEEYNVVFYIGPDAEGFTCDPVPPACAADLDGDGDADSTDLNILLAAFGTTAAGDLNGDSMTTSIDLNILLANFGCVPG